MQARYLVFYIDKHGEDLMGTEQFYRPDGRRSLRTLIECLDAGRIKPPKRARGYRIVNGSILKNAQITKTFYKK